MTAAARAIPLESGADISTPAIKRGLIASLLRDTWLASPLCISLASSISICQLCNCFIFTSLDYNRSVRWWQIDGAILTVEATCCIIAYKIFQEASPKQLNHG